MAVLNTDKKITITWKEGVAIVVFLVSVGMSIQRFNNMEKEVDKLNDRFDIVYEKIEQVRDNVNKLNGKLDHENN